MGPNNKRGYNANFVKQELELQSIAAVSGLRESPLPSRRTCRAAQKREEEPRFAAFRTEIHFEVIGKFMIVLMSARGFPRAPKPAAGSVPV